MAEANSIKRDKEITALLPYKALSPTDDAVGCEDYFDALSWALSNKKQIKNIAISGPYGSGKSSIIQTFIRREEEKKCRSSKDKNSFLNISLATFEPPKDAASIGTGINGSDTKNDIQRLIELSLLQQLFFREKYSKTPDSRLKKIKRQETWELVLMSIAFMAFFLSTFSLFFPKKFSEICVGIDFTSPILRYITLGLFLIGLFYIIYKSSRSLISLSIKKLNLKGAEIEIDKNISKSILNHHIDEIIYFFEVTDYNVVIIEDLDRFGESEVFTKLREINLLINNSKKINREVVFIYAIKDDMFKDKDRAKFFDYMLPVIPIVNFSNSGDKLKTILGSSSTKINNDLIDDISLFIDDMRLLYNIMNEFYVYSKKVSDQLDMNKLLAIIVYKNLFPKDFTELSENKGTLYETIKCKSSYIKDAIVEIDNKINDIKKRIKLAEDFTLSNTKELRSLYVMKAVESITNNFRGFKFGNTRIQLSDLTEDQYFNIIKSGRLEYYYYYSSYSREQSSSHDFNFSDIEKQIHPTLTYDQREAILIDKRTVNNLKKELGLLNVEKDNIRKSKLEDLLQNRKISIVEVNDDNKQQLIDILLRNGYINENYLDYISVFHEGTLSKSDYQFLISVKRELPPQFDYSLNKKEDLLKRIDPFQFEKTCILNFDLLDTLLTSDEDEKKDNLIKQLSNEKEDSITFIDQYINQGQNVDKFIAIIASKWTNIWYYILSVTNYTDERKEEYFLLLMRYASVDSLSEMFATNDEYIASYKEFFTIKMDNDFRRELVKRLQVKFKTISAESPKEELKFLLENNYYEINSEMLKAVIPVNLFDDEAFFTKNYTFIKHSGLNTMIDYIEGEINTYVTNVLLKLGGNTREGLNEYTLLLNNPDLDLKLKEELIQKTETIIQDINAIDSIKVCHLLFNYSKVIPKWENIQSIFERNENMLSEDVIKYLNNDNNANELSKVRMTSEANEDGIKVFSLVCKAIIQESSIKDESYILLLKSIPWWYSEFDISEINEKRMAILIQYRKVNPTVKSYDFLRQNYKGLNIQLIEKFRSEFVDKIAEITIDADDMELLLKSEQIDTITKFKYVAAVNSSVIISSTSNAAFVLQYVMTKTDLVKMDKDLMLGLINKKELPIDKRIKLFSKLHLNLTDEQVGEFLISLGGKYSEIIDKNRRPRFDKNGINKILLDILKGRSYILNYTPDEYRVYHSSKK